MARLLILSVVCLGFAVGCGSSGTTVTPPEKFSEPGELEVLGGAGGNTGGATAPAVKPPPSK
jgi:hypothetical protein